MRKTQKSGRTARARKVRRISRQLRGVLDSRVCCMRISYGARRAARSSKYIVCIGDLVQRTRAQMRGHRGMTPGRLRELEDYLVPTGLFFGMRIPGWKRPDPFPQHP